MAKGTRKAATGKTRTTAPMKPATRAVYGRKSDDHDATRRVLAHVPVVSARLAPDAERETMASAWRAEHDARSATPPIVRDPGKPPDVAATMLEADERLTGAREIETLRGHLRAIERLLDTTRSPTVRKYLATSEVAAVLLDNDRERTEIAIDQLVQRIGGTVESEDRHVVASRILSEQGYSGQRALIALDPDFAGLSARAIKGKPKGSVKLRNAETLARTRANALRDTTIALKRKKAALDVAASRTLDEVDRQLIAAALAVVAEQIDEHERTLDGLDRPKRESRITTLERNRSKGSDS